MKNGRVVKPERIVYITVGFPGAPSGEAFFLPEIRGLIERGYLLTIVPRERRRVSSEEVEPELQAISKIVGLAAPEVLWEFLKTVVFESKLTFSIMRECCLDAKLLDKLRNIRVLPKGIWLGKLVRRQSIDHIHAQWGATTATLAKIAHRVSGVPWSMTLHRGDIVQNNRLRQKVKSASFTRFISLSGLALYERVTGEDALSTGKARVIHMGIAVPPADTLAPFSNTTPFTIVCPANLVPVKGHLFLLEAIELLQRRGVDVRLFLAGQGVLRPKLEAWVREHGLENRVKFMGYQKRHVLLDAYRRRAFNAVVLASIDLGSGQHEGIPVALMEGMAFALPVIATETGGIPELLHGGAGILVPHKDSKRLADAIESLATDHEFASDTARRGRERVLSEFDISGVIESLARAFGAVKSPPN